MSRDVFDGGEYHEFAILIPDVADVVLGLARMIEARGNGTDDIIPISSLESAKEEC